MPAVQKSLLDAFNYNIKKIKKKKKQVDEVKKQIKPKQEKTKKEYSKDKVEEKDVNNNTSENVTVDELVRKGTSVEVDDVYKDIRNGPVVGVITRLMFSEEVEFKEPNINELRKVSLVE